MRRLVKIAFVLSLLSAMVYPVVAQSYYDTKKHPRSTREYDEVAPVMLGNKMIFCSNRPVPGPKTGTDMNNKSFFKIVESEKDEKGKWSDQAPFGLEIATDFHDGPVCFNEKGDYMAFSKCFDEKTTSRSTSKFGLFFADNQGGSWGNLQEYEHNDREANTIYPSFNKDASVLYFSSDRAGGFGGYDLYVSRYQNGKWAPPENLGPRVNTAGNERYPFIHATERLYFSSDGHDNNVGGYDLFYSEFYKGKWISPVKLSAPFNTNFDDYTYFIDEKFENGLFSNNRGGSREIWTFTSTMPKFELCRQQRENNYCFVFFEENTVELDTTLYQYEWDLGDNSKIRAMEAQHCFAGPGSYMVSLNVIDKLTKEVLFSQAEYELNIEKIIQSYITMPDSAKTGEDILLSGLESYFGGEIKGNYYWDFGDGQKGTDASIRHKYLIPGTITVKLMFIENNPEEAKSKPGQANDDPDAIEAKKFCTSKTIVITEN